MEHHTNNDAQSSTRDDVIIFDSQLKHQRPGHTTRKSVRTIFMMAMMLFLWLCAPSQCSYNISALDRNANIYFDIMYDINLIRDKWKLIVYFNMSTYWSALNHVQSYVSHLEEYLHGTTLPVQYKGIIYQLQHEISEIQHYIKILKNSVHRRQRRGLINGVGYVANSLFGVLDERFAKKYQKDIKQISMNEDHLQLLLRNQTSVIEAQYNILQRNEGIMNKQFGLVQKYLQNVTVDTNRIEKRTNNELHILSTSISAMIIISNVRHIQESVINTLTDLSNGHMDAHLLPPEQLEQQLNIIYKHLPNDLTLPADKHNLKELYKLMKISGNITNSYLILEVKIPLVNKETFELDRAISLPQQNYIVEFITPYIAFNLQKDMLLPLSESDIQNCIHTQTNRLLCSINKPIYNLQIKQDICNLSIHDKTMCNTKEAPCRVRWIKLHSDNKWLFSCCGKCTVRIFCSDTGMIMKSLTGNGILHIGQGCTVKSDTLSIFGHNNYLSQVQVQENMHIPTDTSVLNTILNSSGFGQFTPEDHGDEWRRMRSQITNLKVQESAPLSIHDIHQYSIMYTILTLIIVAACVYITIRCRRTKGALDMTSNSPSISIPMTVITSGLLEPAPRTTPRSVRLEIPSQI